MKLLVELHGQNLKLSRAELFVFLQEMAPGAVAAWQEWRHLVVELPGVSFSRAAVIARTIAGKVALSHSQTPLLLQISREEFFAWLEAGDSSVFRELARDFLTFGKDESGEQGRPLSFAVNCSFICPKELREQLYPRNELVRETKQLLGATVLLEGGSSCQVSLKAPARVLGVFLGEKVHIGLAFPSQQRQAFKSRKVQNRPFFSPISLEPVWARALLNLLALPQGSSVYDPFCGTGGLLIEAGLLGYEVIGSDIDSAMVEGTKQNLEHFGIRDFHIFPSDVGAAGEELGKQSLRPGAIVSDFPYGRASSLMKEDRKGLYRRAFTAIAGILEPGSRAHLIIPETSDLELAEESGLRLMDRFEIYIHRSLTRHLCLFEKV